MENLLIEFQNVTKRFDHRTILEQVNLQIYEGHVTTIIGKSGTGKSVLLKHIIGLLKPDEGTILFQGRPIESFKKREWDQYRSHISYMFQNNALFDSLTVFENIALPLCQTTTLNKKDIEHKVMARIEQIDLTEVAHKYPSELSGGMQKRVALGRALVTDPKIVLFDEPTTGQDPIRKNAILSMIAEYKRTFGFTAILISHEIPDVYFISNRILALYDGKIIFQGTHQELDTFEHPFLDEIIESLEGFQEGLTGTYSHRHFKSQYQSALRHKHSQATYTVGVFTVEDLDWLSENIGHVTAQEILKSLGKYISKHAGRVGGFSTRARKDQFVVVLPYSNLEEAQTLLDGLAMDLAKRGMHEIQAQVPLKDCFSYSIFGGLAQGDPSEPIEPVVDEAISRQKSIGQFQCKKGR